MPISKLEHRFVESIPDNLEEGILYVSVKFATVIHLCCCGCRTEVVTPLSPNDWKLKFDGVSITLFPSIGNWSFPCQSHYWVRRNKVKWARRWSYDEIVLAREEDRNLKEIKGTENSKPETIHDGVVSSNTGSHTELRQPCSMFSKLKVWLGCHLKGL